MSDAVPAQNAKVHDDYQPWTRAKRMLWRVQFAAGVVVLAGAVFGVLAWVFGLQSKAEAAQQTTTIRVEYRAADDAIKTWATDQDNVVKTRLDGISQRIDDQSALLKEIRDLVLRDRGRR